MSLTQKALRTGVLVAAIVLTGVARAAVFPYSETFDSETTPPPVDNNGATWTQLTGSTWSLPTGGVTGTGPVGDKAYAVTAALSNSTTTQTAVNPNTFFTVTSGVPTGVGTASNAAYALSTRFTYSSTSTPG